jgi:hypothetical protein
MPKDPICFRYFSGFFFLDRILHFAQGLPQAPMVAHTYNLFYLEGRDSPGKKSETLSEKQLKQKGLWIRLKW